MEPGIPGGKASVAWGASIVDVNVDVVVDEKILISSTFTTTSTSTLFPGGPLTPRD